MRRQSHVAAATGLMTLMSGLAMQAPAAADTPPNKVDVSFTGIPVCGFTVDSHVQGTDKFQVFVDRAGNVSFQDVSHIVSTLTNEANGKVVYVEGSGHDAFPEDPVANPDGTFTATDTITGSPVRIYTSHSDVLTKDVGLVSIVDTFDADGNLISEQVIVHGVHEVSPPDDPAYCAAITAAIG